MATRSALLAALVLALPPARAVAAPENPAQAAPPAAALVPAGPAYPVDAAPAEGAAAAEPAAADVAPPSITAIVDVPAAAPEAMPSPVAASESSEPVAPPAPLTALQRETLRFQMRSYLRQVHERVGAAWAAPLTGGPGARREALVTVVIARDGRVVEARVDRSSRDEGFDRSALRVLARPHLFPPLPPYYQTDALEVGLRFADPARPRR